MGSLFEFSWRVGKNPAHDIPAGAVIYVEGGRRLLRFEYDVERSGLAASLKVSESALKKPVEPAIYWRVGKNGKHYIPEGAMVLSKLYKGVTMELFLAEEGSKCRLTASYDRMPKGKGVGVRCSLPPLGTPDPICTNSASCSSL